MITDARKIDAASLNCDICIIGAGAAGISMAVELSKTAMRVILLESGGLEIDGDTQALYEGDSTGHPFPPLDASRLRFFGGTTNHWEGMSHPLEPFDLMQHEWVANSGWPISFDDISRYYRRAGELCELGRNEYDPSKLLAVMGSPLPTQRLKAGVFRHSPPTRFGEVYRAQIADAKNVEVILNANVTAVEASERADTVDHLVVQTLDGKHFNVAARAYILACGAIENARILLSSTSVVPAGLGNQHDMVGRYFMDHPYATDTAVVEMLESDERILFYDHFADRDAQKTHLRGFLAPTYEAMQESKVLNFGFALVRHNFTEASEGIQSAKQIWTDPWNMGTHIANIWNDFGSITDAIHRKVAFSVPTRFLTHFWMEHAPDPDSRIILKDDRDALGMRRVSVDWRVSEDHLATYRAAHEMFGREIGRMGVARLQMLKSAEKISDIDFTTSYHHMGGTRMSDDPRHGVVDRNCRVHGMDNLFVAGSSVFPTGGHTNPTLNLIALSLRLVEHLKQNVG